MKHEILEGDCLEVMKTFPDNHFSAVVTDAPYGIAFMGKQWDRGIPSIEYWKEMLRILKPGAHLLSAGLPRMMHRLISVIEDAGFEIRDLLMHIFGSGFPKSHNHFGIEGYGTALKPAWEGWSLAMKPLDGTFAQNAAKWGQAGINIDGCRVGYSNEKDQKCARCERSTPTTKNLYEGGLHSLDRTDRSHINGRWPANVIFDEEAGRMLDEQVKGKIHPSGKSSRGSQSGSMFSGFGDSDLGKRVDFSDSGGASRFFYCAKTSSRERNEGLEGFDIVDSPEHSFGRYRCKKCSKLKLDHNPCICEEPEFERIQVNKNSHPCVKPLKLMEYLIRLVMPPKDGLLLDPFAGSGSTILAAKRLGVAAIGIEKSAEYCEIARARIAAVVEVAKMASPQLEMDLDAVNGA